LVAPNGPPLFGRDQNLFCGNHKDLRVHGERCRLKP
jgi:hypothetical protein